jgi:HEAT repeat protein
VWRWLKTLPSNTDWRAAVTLGEIPDVRVREDAIRVLAAPDAGSDARSICIDVLSGPAHAAHVPESVLLATVERARSAEDLVVVERLVEAVRGAAELARTPCLRAFSRDLG